MIGPCPRALLAVLLLATAATHADWVDNLAERVAAIDQRLDGTLGVYVHSLADGRRYSREADRPWYLSSTVKVHVALVLLQQVEDGIHSLDDEHTLREADFVDGAGDLLWQEPGSRHSLGSLLRRMLVDSDSTATDILIRRIGEEELNRHIRERLAADGFRPFTTILQVRYDAYSELHPSARELSNMDIVRLNNTAFGEERLQALLQQLPVERDRLLADSLDQAFERYYQRQLNSGTLEAFGHLLLRLVEGELLSPAHTALILGHMESITTGDNRIQAGLPGATPFAQKTGTQVAQACNVGVIHPRELTRAVVVAACVERFRDRSEAEDALRELGTALTESGLLD